MAGQRPRRTRIRSAGTLFFCLAFSLLVIPVGSALAATAKPSDFNGDGHVDVAIGTLATVQQRPFSGLVAAVYGTGTTLNTARRQRIDESLSWVPGTPQQDEAFGAALASADFNSDGHADLAVCAPTQKETAFEFVGSLTILFGTPNGLTRASRVVANCDEVATGDINRDGRPDLAVVGADQAYVVYGSAGLSNPGGIVPRKFGPTGPDVFARRALAVGDLTGDGYADVVFGASVRNGVRILLYRGGASGLSTTLFQQVSTELTESADVGDINGDGYADLATGNSTSTVTGQMAAGRVRVWYGSSSGLNISRGVTILGQNSPGIPGGPEHADHFGLSVALGDSNGDGRADLAIGAPYEDIDASEDAGNVTVVMGGSAGLDFARVSDIRQSTIGGGDANEPRNRFGSALVFRDLNGDGRAELMVSSVGESGAQGSVSILTGTAQGVGDITTFPLLRPQSVAIPTTSSVYFGIALTR